MFIFKTISFNDFNEKYHFAEWKPIYNFCAYLLIGIPWIFGAIVPTDVIIEKYFSFSLKIKSDILDIWLKRISPVSNYCKWKNGDFAHIPGFNNFLSVS